MTTGPQRNLLSAAPGPTRAIGHVTQVRFTSDEGGTYRRLIRQPCNHPGHRDTTSASSTMLPSTRRNGLSPPVISSYAHVTSDAPATNEKNGSQRSLAKRPANANAAQATSGIFGTWATAMRPCRSLMNLLNASRITAPRRLDAMRMNGRAHGDVNA